MTRSATAGTPSCGFWSAALGGASGGTASTERAGERPGGSTAGRGGGGVARSRFRYGGRTPRALIGHDALQSRHHPVAFPEERGRGFERVEMPRPIIGSRPRPQRERQCGMARSPAMEAPAPSGTDEYDADIASERRSGDRLDPISMPYHP